jgi:hypothetical protein
MKTNLILIFYCILFFLAGAGAIIAGFVIRADVDEFIENGVKIDATIIAIETRGKGEDQHTDVFVKYEIDGVEYEAELNRYSSNKMKVGQTVPIRYAPDDPNIIAYADDEYVGFRVFVVGGIIAISISVIFLIVFICKARYSGFIEK